MGQIARSIVSKSRSRSARAPAPTRARRRNLVQLVGVVAGGRGVRRRNRLRRAAIAHRVIGKTLGRQRARAFRQNFIRQLVNRVIRVGNSLRRIGAVGLIDVSSRVALRLACRIEAISETRQVGVGGSHVRHAGQSLHRVVAVHALRAVGVADLVIWGLS